MANPKIVPLRRGPAKEVVAGDAPVILGKLSRKDFELWVCLDPDGRISLKWWRWREDMEKFQAISDGGLVLDLAELRPLTDLLGSVDALLDRKQRR
jgi:hypothetical protein